MYKNLIYCVYIFILLILTVNFILRFTSLFYLYLLNIVVMLYKQEKFKVNSFIYKPKKYIV